MEIRRRSRNVAQTEGGRQRAALKESTKPGPALAWLPELKENPSSMWKAKEALHQRLWPLFSPLRFITRWSRAVPCRAVRSRALQPCDCQQRRLSLATVSSTSRTTCTLRCCEGIPASCPWLSQSRRPVPGWPSFPHPRRPPPQFPSHPHRFALRIRSYTGSRRGQQRAKV